MDRATQNNEHMPASDFAFTPPQEPSDMPLTELALEKLKKSMESVTTALQDVTTHIDMYSRHIVSFPYLPGMPLPEAEDDYEDDFYGDVSAALPAHITPVTYQEADKSHPQRIITTTLEFVPSANAWKVCAGGTERWSRAPTLDLTPPRIQEALKRKRLVRESWKEAILEFRAIMRKSTELSDRPPPSL